MVKSIITTICVAILLLVGAIIESTFVKNQFNDFHDSLTIVYAKVDEHTATPDDVYAVQKNWLEKKKSLHTIIPHTEIKEVDLWISEAVTLVRDKEWEDAISKIEVLIELSEQIPKTFTLSLSNIL